jgi:hypothetical protein
LNAEIPPILIMARDVAARVERMHSCHTAHRRLGEVSRGLVAPNASRRLQTTPSAFLRVYPDMMVTSVV